MWFIDSKCLEEKLFCNKLTNIDIHRDSQGNFQKMQRLCLYRIYKQHWSPIPLDHCSFLTPRLIVRQYTVVRSSFCEMKMKWNFFFFKLSLSAILWLWTYGKRNNWSSEMAAAWRHYYLFPVSFIFHHINNKSESNYQVPRDKYTSFEPTIKY